MERFTICLGDITQSDAVAIVNAAKNSLLGGSGVDGAIHRVAGPALLAECRGLGGCPTGQARLTSGCNLRAHYVIHTVGPVWQGGAMGEPALLASCYQSSLELAAVRGFASVDFPAISTGIYGYPLPQAADVAVRTILAFLAHHETPHQVRMICHTQEAADAFRQALSLAQGS